MQRNPRKETFQKKSKARLVAAVPLGVASVVSTIVAHKAVFGFGVAGLVAGNFGTAGIPTLVMIGLGLVAGACAGYRFWRNYHADRLNYTDDTTAYKFALRQLEGLALTENGTYEYDPEFVKKKLKKAIQDKNKDKSISDTLSQFIVESTNTRLPRKSELNFLPLNVKLLYLPKIYSIA